MVNFHTLIKDDEITQFQNRVVESVNLGHSVNLLYGKIKTWHGATETEYFIVMFCQGILIVSISEREMLLGTNFKSYSMSEFLFAALNTFDKSDTEAQNIIRTSYDKNILPIEEDDITFEDVMVSLKWKYNASPKIHENFLFD